MSTGLQKNSVPAILVIMVLCLLAFGSTSVWAATFTVTNTNDSGPGSLRQAILLADSTAGVDLINFNIPVVTGASFIIKPLSALPVITDPVIIDGYTQPFAVPNSSSPGVGNNATLLIQLDGTSAGIGTHGLDIIAGGTTVRGLVIHSFGGNGIDLSTAGGNVIEGNFIGIDSSGTTAPGNSGIGVTITTSGNTIGGAAPAAQNIISGNGTGGAASGIGVTGGATGNQVVGNLIGTDRTGTVDLGNSGPGVSLDAAGNTVGGTTAAERNIISGNDIGGVTITFGLNVVVGNYIGTDVAGAAALGNTAGGVAVFDAPNNTIGGTAPGARNVISSNQNGVVIFGIASTGNLVRGNFIGTDVTGTVDLGNSVDGVQILGAPGNTIGGTGAGAGNVISGNTVIGVRISNAGADGNFVQGNLIGTSASGTVAMGNGLFGVQISTKNNTVGGTTAAARNIVSGNTSHGIQIVSSVATGNLVQGNYIGTDVTGTADLGNGLYGIDISNAPGNTVGGTTAGAGNLISGNSQEGVNIISASATGNFVQGNFIGVDVTGTLSLGNSFNGVFIRSGASNNTIGGTTSAARNIISGNVSVGVRMDGGANGNLIQGNYIGTDVSGALAVPNAAGVLSVGGSSNNTIGGTTVGARNIISGNTVDGIDISNITSTGNKVEGNFIGTDVTGITALANGNYGVRFSGGRNNTIGGTTSGARNVISGNSNAGVVIFADGGTALPATGNVIQGNFIGTDSTGTLALGNGAEGIV
ncbi:MAG: hypothetical protein V3V49_14015, partial [Candidatus Krumholzibacteria bacterium]